MTKKTDSTTLFLSQIGSHTEEMARLLAVGTREPIADDDAQRAVRCTSMLSKSASLLELEGLSTCLCAYQQLLEFYVDKRLCWDEKIAQLTSELIEMEDAWITDGEGQRGSKLASVFSTEQLAAVVNEMEAIQLLAEASAPEQAPGMEKSPTGFETGEPRDAPADEPATGESRDALADEPTTDEPWEALADEPWEALADEPATRLETPEDLDTTDGSGERVLDESTRELHRLTREFVDRFPRWDPNEETPDTLQQIRRDLILVGFYAHSIERMIGIKVGDPSAPRLASLTPVVSALRDFSRLLCAESDRAIDLALTGEENALDVRLLSPVVRILQGMIGDIAERCTEKDLHIELTVEKKYGSFVWSLRDNAGNHVSDASHDPDEYLVFYPSLRETYRALAELHSLLWVEPSDDHDIRFAFSLPTTPDNDVFVLWGHDEDSFVVLSNQVSEIVAVGDVELERDARGEYLIRDGHRIPVIRLGEISEGVDVDGDRIVILGHVETRVAFYVDGGGDVVEGSWMKDAIPAWRGVRNGVAQIGDREATVLEASDLLDRHLGLVNDASEESMAGDTLDPAEEAAPADDTGDTREPQSVDSCDAERHVLVVERSEALRNELHSIFAEAGWRTKMVDQLDSAIDSLHKDVPSLIISEFRVPSMAAKVLLERLRLDGSEIPVLVTTTHAGENAERLVQKLGAAGYIRKPLNSSDVLSSIKDIVGDGQNVVAKT